MGKRVNSEGDLLQLCENLVSQKSSHKINRRFLVSNVSHEMLVLALQTLKTGGHVLRGGRNTLEACQYQRVASAALSAHAFCISWQAQHFAT